MVRKDGERYLSRCTKILYEYNSSEKGLFSASRDIYGVAAVFYISGCVAKNKEICTMSSGCVGCKREG